MPLPTSTAALFSRAAAKVSDTFAERDASGRVAHDAVTIELPDGQRVECAGIVGRVKAVRDYQQEGASRESRRKIEEVTITIIEAGLDVPISSSVSIATIGDGWTVEEATRDGLGVDLRLERESVMAKQRSGLERGA